jgi:hypothetical protein
MRLKIGPTRGINTVEFSDAPLIVCGICQNKQRHLNWDKYHRTTKGVAIMGGNVLLKFSERQHKKRLTA